MTDGKRFYLISNLSQVLCTQSASALFITCSESVSVSYDVSVIPLQDSSGASFSLSRCENFSWNSQCRVRRKQFYCWGFDVAAPEWWLIFEERIECVRKNIRHLPLKIKWSDIFIPLGKLVIEEFSWFSIVDVLWIRIVCVLTFKTLDQFSATTGALISFSLW